jgi:hypothetical protein
MVEFYQREISASFVKKLKKFSSKKAMSNLFRLQSPSVEIFMDNSMIYLSSLIKEGKSRILAIFLWETSSIGAITLLKLSNIFFA